MNTLATSRLASTPVGMGQILTARSPERMRAIVGSCIALVLYHPGRKLGVMAHVVLADSDGRVGPPGKYADTAVPAMLSLFGEQGITARGLSARMAGGANMFGGTGSVLIGESNARALAAALKKAGIRVAAQDIGGSCGRRVEFDCATGELFVQCAGQPERSV